MCYRAWYPIIHIQGTRNFTELKNPFTMTLLQTKSAMVYCTPFLTSIILTDMYWSTAHWPVWIKLYGNWTSLYLISHYRSNPCVSCFSTVFVHKTYNFNKTYCDIVQAHLPVIWALCNVVRAHSSGPIIILRCLLLRLIHCNIFKSLQLFWSNAILFKRNNKAVAS